MITPNDIRHFPPALGPGWSGLYSYPVSFPRVHFDAAMDNIIRNPDVNSTILMRADIYFQFIDGTMFSNNLTSESLDPSWLKININDTRPRLPEIPGFTLSSYIVRRNIPRNPSRDYIVNQTCVMYNNALNTDRLVIYIPHCTPEETPFYLPRAQAVALLYSGSPSELDVQAQCSIHYLLHANDTVPLLARDDNDRILRIGLHLLNTCIKHARGIQMGYQKRVNHDQVVDRKSFQNRYILLKQKYASELMANWVEKTDPRKHVFEDLGIAAFLMELWSQLYTSKTDFKFLDLGCGNGLLVYILLSEGYTGKGIDARERKSWTTYPEFVQKSLESQLIVPKVLFDSNSADLAEDPHISWLGGDTDMSTFLIGNHSDELTLWLPLLDHPFMVLPCCSHALSGKKKRFAGNQQKSTYAALVDKAVELAAKAGWKVEQEMLRIPSTRNAAIIGRKRLTQCADVADIVASEGGAEGWVETTRKLRFTTKEH